jgi:hypothetical protein
MKVNLSDEEKEGMIKHLKNCMKPQPLILNDVEIKKMDLPNSVYIIIDDLGEIENVFYNKEKADKHCEFRNNIATMNSYNVEKFNVYDSEDDGEE